MAKYLEFDGGGEVLDDAAGITKKKQCDNNRWWRAIPSLASTDATTSRSFQCYARHSYS
jgi:hypothetical protein